MLYPISIIRDPRQDEIDREGYELFGNEEQDYEPTKDDYNNPKDIINLFDQPEENWPF